MKEAPMIDHMSLPVSDYARAKAFYVNALAPLGYGIAMEVAPEPSGGESYVGFGNDGKPYFWLAPNDGPQSRIHVAFVAKDRAAVDAFYPAALAAGGKDNGAPGLRAHYHPNYYGAFVLDPDGHNVEAVCDLPA
jgi:catechol 2,3-dioxygenase-like lactoylglutathione lyase family enzyme